MQKNPLIELLNQYNTIYPEELEYKKTIINFIENNINCFERSLTEGHITASCLLLNKSESAALLMHHKKLDMWLQLGGHCDGNKDVLSVAIKEAQEESGIINVVPVDDNIFDIDIHLIPEHKQEKAHYHYDIRFLLKVDSDEKVIQNSESKALKWIDKDISKLPTNEPSVKRLFEKWINK